MLNELKSQKRIKDMAVGEEGYLMIGAIIKDEKGNEWLNTNAIVSKKYRVLSRKIQRTSDTVNGFEISAHDLITANADITLTGQSECLAGSSSLIPLDAYSSDQSVDEFRHTGASVDVSLPNKKILEPLYNIFLETDILNTVLIRTGIPEIINGRQPGFNGVILYGKGGTGKTALQKAISLVYKNAGALSVELNVARMSEKYIGSLSNNLDEKISEILVTSEKLNSPAFIFLDEASSLVMSSAKHNESGVDYYQEAVDVLKKYISNYPQLVFSITTNIEPDSFDDTLVREGRLHPIHIPYPGETQKIEMWKYFLKLFEIADDLSDTQYNDLAKAIPAEQGAFINEFCKSYIPMKKLKMETEQSGATNLLDSLARGSFISVDNVRESITFEDIFKDLILAVEKKHTKEPSCSAPGFLN